jgi:hypothetical protein
MVTLNVPYMFNNEQLPVSGVPMPVFNWSSGAVTYGIIQGTNIGYIYVWHQNYSTVSSEFDAAVRALMGTEGLIIDLRFNQGGVTGLNLGISRLLNHSTPTLDAKVRCSPSNLYTLCPYSTWSPGLIPADTGTYYDRPIAVLLGPDCLSYGDISSWQLSYVSNVRTFGRPPMAVFSGWGFFSHPSRPGYYLRTPDITLVDHFAPNLPLWGQEYPLDEEIWLTPDDVANGDDTVVKRASEWIEHVSYANRVRVASAYLRPGLDSGTVTSRLNNPDGHSTRILAYVRNEVGMLIDSLRMYDDGLHGDSLAGDGLYGTRVTPPATEDLYSVSVTTYDSTNGLHYELTRAAQYFSSGPLKTVGRRFWSLTDTIPNPGDNLNMRLLVRNQGSSDTVENVLINVFPLDTFITCTNQSNNLAILPPNAEQWTAFVTRVGIHSATPGGSTHSLRLEMYSETYPAWTDTLSLYIYPAVGVEEEESFPTKFALEQNYPNPWNPSTNIRYALPHTSIVTLTVYNTLGQQVAQLVNAQQQAGYHDVVFRGDGLASGVYFYRIQAGDFIATRKLLYLK